MEFSEVNWQLLLKKREQNHFNYGWFRDDIDFGAIGKIEGGKSMKEDGFGFTVMIDYKKQQQTTTNK